MRIKKRLPDRKRWLRILVGVALAILIPFSVFMLISYRMFNRTPPANLPCRQCTGDARAVHVNGLDLYFRELGDDARHAPIVILHGGPGHSSDSFKASLDFLAQDYHIIYYDQRGSGHSQIKPDASLYTMDQLVEELEVIRRDVIGADKITILAHSAGGALAQRYSLAYPEQVDAMMLVSSVQINNGVSNPTLWDVFIPGLFALGAGWPPADPEAADQWFMPILVESSAPRLFDQSNLSIIENSGYISFATWREISRSMEGQDYKDLLGVLPTKTLIIYGVADNAATGETTATMLHQLLPNSILVRFEKSGHWAFLEQPERFQEVIVDFLTGN